MTRGLIWIALGIVCWTSAANGATTLNSWSEDTSESLAHSSLKFAWDGYRALGVASGENVFYSPYSITNAVGMLILGSGGTLEAQLKQAIRIPSTLTDDQLHGQLSTQNDKLASETEAIIGVANRFFINAPLASRLNPDYKSGLTQYYKSGIEATPFSTNPTQAKTTVNDFVSEKTHGEIDQILVETPNPNTLLMLVNAIYFKGTWTSPFKEENTRPGPFVTRSGNVTAQFMRTRSRMPHAHSEELHARMLALSYTENEKYAFYVIVPEAGHDLESLEANLDDVKIRQLASQLSIGPVDLKLPRLSMKSRFDLTNMLESLGATGVDQPQDSTNSRMFIDSFHGSFIDEVIHEAKVSVNENGTVAAGATVIGIAKSSAVRYQPLHLNRPFLFFIADVSNGYVLFWGRVEDPSAEE